ncbi:hypothetical protein GGI07_005272 [Coemansia sp. Benny D115]|nr:hypothetical protein GGI07_005272 [Coemansia sp. Benny D115]
MSTTENYSFLDGAKSNTAFDPMNLSYSPRPRLGATQTNDGSNPAEPPSLELLAEMIKEEIRQASSLKQALDRVGMEADRMVQRVSDLPVCDETVPEPTDQIVPKVTAHSSSAAQGDDRNKRRVQFTIPDDVRFRWLGIFQQPSDSENSDSEDQTNKETAQLSPKALAGEIPVQNMASQSSANTPTPRSSSLARDALDASSPPGGNVDGSSSEQSTMPPGLAVRANQGVGLAAEHLKRSKPLSQQLDNDPGSPAPPTSNSSIEAVYGGSRPDTRESSALNIHQIQIQNTQDQLRSIIKRSSDQRLVDTAQLQQTPSTVDAAIDGALLELSASISKYATISAKGNRRRVTPGDSPLVTNQRTAAHAQPTLATSKVTVPKRYSVSPPFAAPQIASAPNGARTAHSDDTVGALFERPPPLPTQPAVHRSGSVQPRDSEYMGEYLSESQRRRRNSFDGSSTSLRRAQNIFNGLSGAFGGDAASSDSNGNSSNGADSTSQQRQQTKQHMGGKLLRRVTTSAAQHRSNSRQHSGDESAGGIIGGTRDFFKNRLRTRTQSNSNSNSNGEAPAKKPLLSAAVAHVVGNQASAPEGAAEYRKDLLGGDNAASKQERARRRSDAEVKSRAALLSPQPSIPESYPQKPLRQQHAPTKKDAAAEAANGDRGGVASRNTKKATVAASLFPTQSEGVIKTPPQSQILGNLPEAVSRKQRKSHDDVLLPLHSSEQRHSRASSSAEYSRQSHNADRLGHRGLALPPDSTLRLTKKQLELLRLRPANSGGEGKSSVTVTMLTTDGDNGTIGTRSKGQQRRNTGDSASHSDFEKQQPPRSFTSNIGRAQSSPEDKPAKIAVDKGRNDAYFDNNNEDDSDSAFNPPPFPKMPPLPPLPGPMSPLSPSTHNVSPPAASAMSMRVPGAPNAGRRRETGDVDSIEHHLRRLKSDKKTRRSSFMTTISSMLGRKD